MYRLEMVDISKAFPGVQALDNVTLRVLPGEVHALLGENGAGKSTLMKILSGAYARDAGEILVDERPVEIHAPSDALALGIVTIYQESNLCPNLSIAENVFAGRLPRRKFFVDRSALRRNTQAVLDRLDVRTSPDELVRNLSPAQAQMVEIAKALSISARIIVLDEPTAALTQTETDALFAVVRDLRAQGLSVVLITHRLAEVFRIADRATIFRDGKWVLTEEVPNLTEEKLILSMVGRNIVRQSRAVGTAEATTAANVLEVSGLTGARFRNAAMHVRKGEIVGLFGLVGAGRTELVRAIFGAEPATAGTVLVDGAPVEYRSPADAIAQGIALVPEDRKSQGLVLMEPVVQNVSLPSLHQLMPSGWLRPEREVALAEEYRASLDIRCPNVQTRAGSLSGGNQQKVVIAKWLARKPRVLIVDEPTRGIDVGAKAEVYALLRALATQGVGVLIVSSELPEILALCDRIYVMWEGAVVAEVAGSEATEELLLSCASGRGQSVISGA